ncbi:MAG: sensor histidine kinase [Caldilineaceae bacterium]|nr:sensor histidine kinase [Caldilineaceae bacterium]
MMNRAKLSLRLILTIVFGGMLLLMAALLSVTVENLAARQMHRVASESLATLAQRMIQGLEQELTAADIAQFARTSENLQLQEPETQIDLFIISRDGHLLLAPEALDDIQLPVLEQGDALPVAGSTASIIKWADGRNYMTVWVPGQFQGEPANASWYVLARQPADLAFAAVVRLRWQVLTIGALVTLIFGVLVWYLAGWLTAQLRIITQAAEDVRLGVPNAVIPIFEGNAEVASLSHSLNQLVTDLTTAAAAERNRIARELHDSVTQTLFSASMLADVLPDVWDADPELGHAKLDDLRHSVRGALAEMRTLLLELRPAAVVDADWNQLLRQLADITRLRSGVDVAWRVDGECNLYADVKLALYRVTQEALNNVAKYAEADQAQVYLRCRSNQVMLTIVDDGCGFEVDKIEGDHFGLQMMKERVESIGGELHIQSAPGEGTEVRVLWQRRAWA